MRIVVDAFGGDNAPIEIIKGASIASHEYKVEITLTGDEKAIDKCILDNKLTFYGDLEIVHTEDVISMHDDPTSILKAHNNCSMALAFKELAEEDIRMLKSVGIGL